MADIELIIKIPEEQYKTIKSDLYNTFPAEMKKWGLEAIRNGTQLPKGHGRLIDAEVFAHNVVKYSHQSTKTIGQALTDTPTIIEVDKTESEE